MSISDFFIKQFLEFWSFVLYIPGALWNMITDPEIFGITLIGVFFFVTFLYWIARQDGRRYDEFCRLEKEWEEELEKRKLDKS